MQSLLWSLVKLSKNPPERSDKVLLGCKDEIVVLQAKNDTYAKVVGQLTVENNWMQGKLKSLGLSDKRQMIEPKLKSLSTVKQCELLSLSRSSLYYEPTVSAGKLAIKEEIKSIFAPQGHFLASLTAGDTHLWS